MKGKNFLNSKKMHSIEENMYIFEAFKSKHVSSNVTTTNVKRQASNVENIFATHKIYRRLASRLFSSTYYIQINKKMITQ